MSKPLLSLCMIVRDAARTLPECLASIAPWVDEIVIVDTGSVDDTREAARQFSAELSEFRWRDDFSAARNASLNRARGEWVFWMDADDIIDPENGAKLQSLIREPHPAEVMGFVLQVHCPGESSSEWTAVDHVKVFRNRPSLRFEGRIHEQILPSIRAAGGDVRFTDIFVVHSGADCSPAGRQRKHARDVRLLLKEAADRPNHPFTLFNLGMTLIDMGRCEEAIIHLEASLAFSAGESHVRKLYSLLCAAYQQIGRTRQAIQVCERGLSLFPDDPELWFRLGGLWHKTGDLRRAESAYRRVAPQADAPRVFLSRDASILGHKLYHNLGLVYADQQHHSEAAVHFRRALAQNPLYTASLQELVRSLLALGEVQEARRSLNQYLSSKQVEVRMALEARIESFIGDHASALALLRRASEKCPNNVDVLQELASIAFSCQDFAQAEGALTRMTALRPNDPTAYHNLGLVMHNLGKPEHALAALEISLRLRPDAGPTQALAAHCRRMVGKVGATAAGAAGGAHEE